MLGVTLTFIAQISLFIQMKYFKDRDITFSPADVPIVQQDFLFSFSLQSSSFNSRWEFCGLNLLVIHYGGLVTSLNNNKTKGIML